MRAVTFAMLLLASTAVPSCVASQRTIAPTHATEADPRAVAAEAAFRAALNQAIEEERDNERLSPKAIDESPMPTPNPAPTPSEVVALTTGALELAAFDTQTGAPMIGTTAVITRVPLASAHPRHAILGEQGRAVTDELPPGRYVVDLSYADVKVTLLDIVVRADETTSVPPIAMFVPSYCDFVSTRVMQPLGAHIAQYVSAFATKLFTRGKRRPDFAAMCFQGIGQCAQR